MAPKPARSLATGVIMLPVFLLLLSKPVLAGRLLERLIVRYRTQICTLMAMSFLIATATAANAPGEIQRHYYNSVRIQKLHPWAQPKAGAILADMEMHGDKPVIQPDVWRTPARQAQLRREGKSSLSYSYHTVTGRHGEPESLAIDIADFYKGYRVDEGFWLRYASSAQRHEMTTGVYWGLQETARERIRQLIQSKAWSLNYIRGGDAGHAEPQPQIITLSEAKRGLRPPINRSANRSPPRRSFPH